MALLPLRRSLVVNVITDDDGLIDDLLAEAEHQQRLQRPTPHLLHGARYTP